MRARLHNHHGGEPNELVRAIVTECRSSCRRSIIKFDHSSSRIKPLFEMRLEALEHLFFNVFDVGELAPTSEVAVFRRTLNLHDKFFHQALLVPVFLPEMLLANVRRLFLPALGS